MTYYGSTIVIHRRVHLLCSSFLLGFCKCSFSESIGTSAEHFLQMSHTSSARCLSSLGLGSPVEASSPCTGVTTRCTRFLLDVVRFTTTSYTQGVRLVVSFTKTGGSLSHVSPVLP